jgi:hypothetical protein
VEATLRAADFLGVSETQGSIGSYASGLEHHWRNCLPVACVAWLGDSAGEATPRRNSGAFHLGFFYKTYLRTFFLVNVSWGIVILIRRQWQSGKAWLLGALIWLVAIAIDLALRTRTP